MVVEFNTWHGLKLAIPLLNSTPAQLDNPDPPSLG